MDISAHTVAHTFYSVWISRFGLWITTDQGRQFEADLFHRLAIVMGIVKQRTTAYHPQSNGAVERWHRSLKVALMTHLCSERWTQVLPTVLLGLRSVLREDIGGSVAEAVYGTPLRLPGEFLELSSAPEPCLALQQLREDLSRIKPTVAKDSNARRVFQHRDLSTCSHVFLREDAVRKPLIPPYSGPYKVVRRGDNVFTILRSGQELAVSIDRLKPAYLLTEEDEHDTSWQRGSSSPPAPRTAEAPCGVSPQPPEEYKTRSGRIVKKRVEFCDSVTRGGVL